MALKSVQYLSYPYESQQIQTAFRDGGKYAKEAYGDERMYESREDSPVFTLK